MFSCNKFTSILLSELMQLYAHKKASRLYTNVCAVLLLCWTDEKEICMIQSMWNVHRKQIVITLTQTQKVLYYSAAAVAC